MKLYTIFFIFCFGFSSFLMAQKLSKEERQDLSMELIQIRQDLSILRAWRNREEQSKKQLEGVKAYKDSLLTAYDVLADQLDQTEENIANLKTSIREFRLQNRNIVEKVFFKVQFQAATQHPLDRFANRSPSFSAYRDGRLNLYLLGQFYDYQEAKYFSNWLNLKGASTYIVGFKNGQKVRMLYNYIQK